MAGSLARPEKLLKENVNIGSMTWWKVGGAAEFFAQPENSVDLNTVFTWAHKSKLPIHILSGGSNVLVSDEKTPGLTVSLSELKGIIRVDESERFKIECLAGTPKSDVAREFLTRKLAPAVFLTGIPGDMGGGVVMNAGVGEKRTPREFCEIVDEIEVLKWNEEEGASVFQKMKSSELSWSYRHSKGWQPGIITRMKVSWQNQPKVEVLGEVREATKKRVRTQPLNLPSGGSVFKNPEGHKSAQLIESCGLKGFKIGGAEVSEKHANFIVNRGNATSLDIHNLICHIRDTVYQSHGVRLETEVVYFGNWNLN